MEYDRGWCGLVARAPLWEEDKKEQEENNILYDVSRRCAYLMGGTW